MYYVINILLPVIFLGSLTIVVFLIPAESGEKISYSITVLLAISVFLSIISTILPRNSDDVCLLAVYLLINVILGVLAVIFTALQLKLLAKEDEVPNNGLCATLISCSRIGRHLTPNINQTAATDDQRNTEIDEDDRCNKFTWKDVVKALDVIFFWVFFILYVVSTSKILGTLIIYYYASYFAAVV